MLEGRAVFIPKNASPVCEKMVRSFVILQKWWMFLLKPLPLFAQQVTRPKFSSHIKIVRNALSCASRRQNIDDVFCNTDLTTFELHTALSVTKHTSPGPDEITHFIIQHLSEHYLLNILYMFNRIWKEHVFADCWKHAFIIPIPKPGKDPQDPLNYRPMALTSCMCKLYERIVNVRLVADRSCLLRVYRSIIRSVIDYRSVMCGSARASYLKRLDYVHQALRLCLGASRTSPLLILYTEAFEPSLSCRRNKMSLYYFRILSKDDHPLRGTLSNGNNNRLFNARPSRIPHFGLRA
ncbi:hypothetical protein AVEN_91581-1 [Araneus ventricosus]|uniref:RNA-directed DNA polymerase from mobile element jockey n=1 Tax=Araneus ventricosus TaxID=182803 RepID=A0A4Y2IVL0_ARAVE|nr:hypothetical protein AVEN_91581-1 [Araneus ventricosus]